MSLSQVKTWTLEPISAGSINGGANSTLLIKAVGGDPAGNIRVHIASYSLPGGGHYHRCIIPTFTVEQQLTTASRQVFFKFPTQFKRFIAGSGCVIRAGGEFADISVEPIGLVDGVATTALEPCFRIMVSVCNTGAIQTCSTGASFDIFTEQ